MRKSVARAEATMMASLHALLLAALVAAPWANSQVEAATTTRCDPAALRGLRFELTLEASNPWSHASVILDVSNNAADQRNNKGSLAAPSPPPQVVNLAGLHVSVGLALRVGALTTTAKARRRHQRVDGGGDVGVGVGDSGEETAGSQKMPPVESVEEETTRTTAADLVEWAQSPSDAFRSFCLYGEMVSATGGGGGEEEASIFRDGDNACDDYARVWVDSAGVHFAFNVEGDNNNGRRSGAVFGEEETTRIPLCAGCHFGGGIGGGDGIHGMVYHESGGVLDVDSLSEVAPVVGVVCLKNAAVCRLTLETKNSETEYIYTLHKGVDN